MFPFKFNQYSCKIECLQILLIGMNHPAARPFAGRLFFIELGRQRVVIIIALVFHCIVQAFKIFFQ